MFIKRARTLYTLPRNPSGFLFLAYLEFCMLDERIKAIFNTLVFWLVVQPLHLEDWLLSMEFFKYAAIYFIRIPLFHKCKIPKKEIEEWFLFKECDN